MGFKQSSQLWRGVLVCILLSGYPLGHALANEQSALLEQAQQAFFSQNYVVAEQLLVPLSEQGHAEAQYYLGLVYQENQNSTDDQFSIELWRSAAQQHYALAMHELGQAYELGQFVEKDLLTALDWYRKAKQAEVPSKMLYLGQGQETLVETSHEQILQKWLDKANNGDQEAPFRLAQLYDQYNQPSQAFTWYKAAAEQGHQYAQLMLGYFYCRGIATTVDPVTANIWLKRSDRVVSCPHN